MPGIARDNGKDFAGGALIQGSGNVFVNSKPAVRKGDLVAAHGKPPHAPAPVMVGSSGSVFVNGKGVCRAGDAASCGHTASGSGNVFAGG
jgi:uncharacterized Zn-binding protein involved in type VI secretion